MKIVIIRKDSLKHIPPLLSAADILADLGHQVHIISTDFTPSIRENLKSHGITYQELNFSNYKSKFGMVCSYIGYRFAAKRALEKLDFDLLWVEDAHTMTILGSVIKRYKYVLQVSELYDDVPYLFNGIKKVIHNAERVFMPEYNRSLLYKIWFGLKEMPVLLPNKPYFIPSVSKIIELRSKYKTYFDQIQGRKVILYQGFIHPMRTISAFVKAASMLGDDFVFVVMGRDSHGMVQKYKSMNQNLIHIDFIPAPDYLTITSIAHIGILSYAPINLNNAYCAPNKIYEYGAFGIPMIGNNIPGLKVLEQQRAGLTVDEDDVDAIYNAYLDVDRNHSLYTNNSRKLFDKTDNGYTIEKALSSLNLD